MENKEQQISFQKKLSQVNNFGCVAINRETLQVLLIKLRWTRSGAKSLFHILNGLDNTEKDIENINQILQNCTDKELKIFSTDINKLLNESKIPVSWQYKNGINLKENIQNNFEFIKKICLKELEFRNKSQTYKPNPDQLSRHMWMIPKGKAEKSQNYINQPTQTQQNEQLQQTENQAQYIVQNQQIINDNQYSINIKQQKEQQNVQQFQNDLEFQMINAKREFSEETDVPEQDIYFVQDSQNQYVSFQASNGLKCFVVYLDQKWEIQKKWYTLNNETKQARWFSLQKALGKAFTKGMIDILKKLNKNFSSIDKFVKSHRKELCSQEYQQLENKKNMKDNPQPVTKKIQKISSIEQEQNQNKKDNDLEVISE